MITDSFRATKRLMTIVHFNRIAMQRGEAHVWIEHYKQEGMADSIEFAEAHRRLHLRGLCDRNSCYFCHFHDMHAPYV